MAEFRSIAGIQVQQWLDSHNKTQGWLAERAGKILGEVVPQSSISALILKGVEPRASLAAAIERVTGVRVSAWGDASSEPVVLHKRGAA